MRKASSLLLPLASVALFICSIAQAQDPTLPTSSSSSETVQPPPIRISPDPTAHVTVLEDTLLRVRTNTPLGTNLTREGTPVLFTLSEDVAVDNVLIVPRGATVYGIVVQSRRSGTLTGSPELVLKLTSLELAGQSYPLYTYQFKVEGASKTRPTERKIKGGAVVGALVGGAITTTARETTNAVVKLASITTGAAVGAGIGTASAAAAQGPSVTIPAEAQMDFYLASPISVLPPTAQDAQRLATRVRPGEPVLYVHGETP